MFHFAKKILIVIRIGLLAGCAVSQSIAFFSESASGQVNVTGDLYRPEGNGPFPAVSRFIAAAAQVRARAA